MFLAVDDYFLVFLNEFEFVDARTNRGLPGKTILRRRDDFASGNSIARDHTSRFKLPTLHTNAVGMPNTSSRIMAETNWPRLRRNRKPRQINHDRKTPAGNPHRRTGVGQHSKSRECCFAVVTARRQHIEYGIGSQLSIGREPVLFQAARLRVSSSSSSSSVNGCDCSTAES